MNLEERLRKLYLAYRTAGRNTGNSPDCPGYCRAGWSTTQQTEQIIHVAQAGVSHLLDAIMELLITAWGKLSSMYQARLLSILMMGCIDDRRLTRSSQGLSTGRAPPWLPRAGPTADSCLHQEGKARRRAQIGSGWRVLRSNIWCDARLRCSSATDVAFLPMFMPGCSVFARLDFVSRLSLPFNRSEPSGELFTATPATLPMRDRPAANFDAGTGLVDVLFRATVFLGEDDLLPLKAVISVVRGASAARAMADVGGMKALAQLLSMSKAMILSDMRIQKVGGPRRSSGAVRRQTVRQSPMSRNARKRHQLRTIEVITSST